MGQTIPFLRLDFIAIISFTAKQSRKWKDIRPMDADRCRIVQVWIHPRSIHLLTSIIEAYEGLGVVSTDDPHLAQVRIAVAPGCEADLMDILRGEQHRLGIRFFQENGPLQ